MSHAAIDYLKSLPNSEQFNLEIIEKLFHEYKNELLQWNKIMNLMSEGDFPRIESRHFLDSIMPAPFIKSPSNIIDIGSGSGLPGLPLKIIFPGIRLTMLDSNKKKCQFLDHVRTLLRLDDVEVISDRAETISKNTTKRESYDFAVTRAFANPAPAIEMVLPFVKIGGKALFWGSEDAWGDTNRINQLLSLLGGKYDQHLDYVLPEDSAGLRRRITVASKVSATPENYPRAVGIPQKRPLGE